MSGLVVPEVVLILLLSVEHAVEEIVATPETHAGKNDEEIRQQEHYSARAIMAYLHKFLVHQFDTSKTWSF